MLWESYTHPKAKIVKRAGRRRVAPEQRSRPSVAFATNGDVPRRRVVTAHRYHRRTPTARLRLSPTMLDVRLSGVVFELTRRGQHRIDGGTQFDIDPNPVRR